MSSAIGTIANSLRVRLYSKWRVHRWSKGKRATRRLGSLPKNGSLDFGARPIVALA